MLRPSFLCLLSGRQALHVLRGPTFPRWQSLIVVPRVHKHSGNRRGRGTDNVQDRLVQQFRTKIERDTAQADLYLGPLPEHARVLQQAFASGRQDPFNKLEEHLKDDEMDIAVLRVCLHAANRDIFKYPIRDRISAYEAKRFNIARQVLRRIWGYPEIWLRIPQDHDAIYALCWFAVAENLDDMVVKWIQADISSDTGTMELARTIYAHRIGVWRATVLRNLLGAITVQPGKNADRALNCIFEIDEHRALFRAQDGKWKEGTLERDISLRPSILGLRQYLGTGAARNTSRTSPKLFERFIQMIKDNPCTSDPLDPVARVDPADLWLCHPTSPNAEPFLDLVRQYVPDSSVPSRLEVPDNCLRTFRHCMKRAHAILIASRRDAEAQFIAEVHQNTYERSIDAYEKDDEYRTRLPRGWKPPAIPTPHRKSP